MRAACEQAARAEGLRDFQLTERGSAANPTPAGIREEYFPIYFVEPLHRNERALGFDVASDPVRVSPAVLAGLPGRLRQAQRVFSRTGGLHAAGLFGPDGTLLVLREDVGRHNAVDKVAGWALRNGRLPLAGHVLLVSGRASFELAQKAIMIGVPVLAAVSAPSSLAASLAEESGLTLVGFLRGTTMNVYAGAERIVTADTPVATLG